VYVKIVASDIPMLINSDAQDIARGLKNQTNPCRHDGQVCEFTSAFDLLWRPAQVLAEFVPRHLALFFQKTIAFVFGTVVCSVSSSHT
jgi:hypothetical protein